MMDSWQRQEGCQDAGIATGRDQINAGEAEVLLLSMGDIGFTLVDFEFLSTGHGCETNPRSQ